jgi:hypothetical protein
MPSCRRNEAALLCLMSRKDKLIARFLRLPSDFTWDELTLLLGWLGYQEAPGGKTGGSRRRFLHATAPAILLHKPHPAKTVRLYALRDVLHFLKGEGLL